MISQILDINVAQTCNTINERASGEARTYQQGDQARRLPRQDCHNQAVQRHGRIQVDKKALTLCCHQYMNLNVPIFSYGSRASGLSLAMYRQDRSLSYGMIYSNEKGARPGLSSSCNKEGHRIQHLQLFVSRPLV